MPRKKKESAPETDAAAAADAVAMPAPEESAEPKASEKSAESFNAIVERVANVGGEKKGFKVLSLRCAEKAGAGSLKVIGDAVVGDKVKVTVTKQ